MKPAFRNLTAHAAKVDLRECGDVVYLRHPEPLLLRDSDLIGMLERCCDLYAHRAFLAERDGAQWRTLTFSDFINWVQHVAAALETQGVRRGERVGLLAVNSIDHAIANFAVLALGAVAVPLSPAYLAHPHGADLLSQMASAARVSKLVHDDLLDVTALGVSRRLPLGRLMTLARQEFQPATIAQRRGTLRARDTAKIFFTSGSTGTPKLVRLTHRMLVSAATALDQVAPRLPTGLAGASVDWLPWTHTFGGNVHVHAALMRGKTLYIDGGVPLPGRFDTTVNNLHDVKPTEFGSVPAAYPLLVQALEADNEFARAFFERLHTCSYGGAALSPTLVDRLQAIAVRTCGERIPFGGGYGMTEACGLATLVYWLTERTDLLGLPVPGVEIKLVRIEAGRWECRVRGPNVFSGYGTANDRSVFDDEGYFITGDAVEFASPGNPSEGLVFAGRIKEDFKLASGTWVRAGSLRETLLNKLRPLASDVVIAGENRSELAALVWSSQRGPALQDTLSKLCREFNAGRTAATQRIARVALCDQPPDANAGELTIKGTINMRKLIDNRRELIDEIYANGAYRVD
jgi:feruloyl-CoA synthase